MTRATKVVHKSSAKFQYLAAFVANLLTMGQGITNGWASPNLPILKSNDSPLPSGKITIEQASWIASLICIGGIIGNTLIGIASAKYGRKITMISLTIPSVIAWMLVLYAQNIYYLYASRILSGFVGGGIFIVVPAFLSEIAIDRVRGMLGSTLVLFCNGGILLAFVFGSYLDYFATPKFVIALMILTGVLLFFFPETPSFLAKQNKLLEAEASIRFYQNLKGEDNDYDHLQSELNKLKNTVGISSDEKTNDNTTFKWSELTVAPGKKAMQIGLVLALLNQFCGCFAMLQYTNDIFKSAGSRMSPNTATIFVGVIQIIGSFAPTLLVERTGRKFLFVASTFGIAFGFIILGAYMTLKTRGIDVDAYSWIPVTSFSFVIFIANWAVLTLPFLVISEIMPEKLKNFGSSVCMNVLWSSCFLVIKCMPLLENCLGVHGTAFLFSSVCILGGLFILSSMPETKGKTYDEIMNLLH